MRSVQIGLSGIYWYDGDFSKIIKKYVFASETFSCVSWGFKVFSYRIKPLIKIKQTYSIVYRPFKGYRLIAPRGIGLLPQEV